LLKILHYSSFAHLTVGVSAALRLLADVGHTVATLAAVGAVAAARLAESLTAVRVVTVLVIRAVVVHLAVRRADALQKVQFFFLSLTVKQSFSINPFPAAGMSTTKLSLGGNILYMTSLFPPRESLVSNIPAGDGNIEKFFYGVVRRCMTRA
jgi:hypothetical protein